MQVASSMVFLAVVQMPAVACYLILYLSVFALPLYVLARLILYSKRCYTRYGMSKKFGLMGLETVESQYLEGRSSLNCADNTAAEIDTEVIQVRPLCEVQS